MIEYVIKKSIAKLSDNGSGLSKELNLISWNGATPKYDIRSWKQTEDGKKLYKGITLTAAEMEALKEAVKDLEIERNTDHE